MIILLFSPSTPQHDAQMDYYGKQLATCSSDRTVKLFEIVNNNQNYLTTLRGWAGGGGGTGNSGDLFYKLLSNFFVQVIRMEIVPCCHNQLISIIECSISALVLEWNKGISMVSG